MADLDTVEESLMENQASEVENETVLDQTLGYLETFLFLFGFSQSTFLSFLLSWFEFLLLGVALPVLAFELFRCSSCSSVQIVKFELYILASQAILAAISLLCISHNLRKYGLRKFLFVDRYHGYMCRFHEEYVEKVKDFFRKLLWWIIPCLLLKTVREIIRVVYVPRDSWCQSVAILLALLVSWIYLTTIFLSACILFFLVCNLQIIHFEDYGNLLQRDLDVPMLLEEHMRLRHHLSKISHRFRIYLLLAFLVVTTTQLVHLFQTTGYRHIINVINGGDFVINSIVQVVGIVLCLHAAAKISHRAQGIGSVASSWNALVTCSSSDSTHTTRTNSSGNLNAAPPISFFINYSESDLESLENGGLPTNTNLASSMSSYHKRQSLVAYLQSNPGGLTIFGWVVDRVLISTIFATVLSVAMFVLGMTIGFEAK